MILEAWHAAVGALPFEWARYAFMRQALLAVVLAAPVFGLLGTMVVTHRMAFFSDAVGHSALCGIAIGVLLGLGDPLAAMVGFALLFGAGILVMKRATGLTSDTVIGLFMSFAVALGIVLLSRGGKFNQYGHYLIGDILGITPGQVGWLAGVGLLAVVALLAEYNGLLLIGLNPSLASSRGVRVKAVEMGFGLLTALVVTVNLQWVGMLILNAMLVLPAAAARNLSSSARGYAGWAVALSTVSGVAGLLLSYGLGTATGATIVLVAMALFLGTAAWARGRR